MRKPIIARSTRAIPRAQWDSHAGWHTYAAQPESGSFLVFWNGSGRPGVRLARAAGWWIYDQHSAETDGPFLSSRAAFVAARQGATGRIILPVQIDLDRLLGLG